MFSLFDVNAPSPLSHLITFLPNPLPPRRMDILFEWLTTADQTTHIGYANAKKSENALMCLILRF